MNIKFISAKQAKETYQYRNIEGKLYKTNAAVWYNKNCKEKQLALNHISIISHLAAGSSSCLTYACFRMCSLELLMMDGKTVRNM
jgi:hypothetical protein